MTRSSNTDRKRLAPWLRKPLGRRSGLHRMKAMLRSRNLHTVCEEARCPNIGECFSKPTATFMILGDRCTRNCSFCSVEGSGRPAPPDPGEPRNIAEAARELGLRHVVVTSVTRDDLPLGGAEQFALTIRALRDTIPGILVEVLTPDFGGDRAALDVVLDEGPDIFNHNLETVRSLYPLVRPQADYERSLQVLGRAAARGLTVKSGIMVGFGESVREVLGLLDDLKAAGCSMVTIGQYLRPARDNIEVARYVEPRLFEEYGRYAREIGIHRVYSGPFVRSSYNAEEVYAGGAPS
ncbi:MAG TPA: lipoyl synthase [Deltaproteobacteria bacterium]|nr:lipoyl synthase [Deltaproteobacteria bacterium]